jgi:RNA polymerase sigma factor (TIGR02999 family)
MFDGTDNAGGAPGAHLVTLALREARGGDTEALNRAFALVYDEIRAIAHARRVRLGAGGTLDTTAVVHEAYLKLARHGGMAWEDRSHFLAVASKAMRQVLLDRARRKLADKRGGGAEHVPLTVADPPAAATAEAREVLALEEALGRLETVDPRLVRVVELRFFGGLTVEETARALGISEPTVKRDWQRARLFLHRELTGPGPA